MQLNDTNFSPVFNQLIWLGTKFFTPFVVLTILRLADLGLIIFFIGIIHIPEHSKAWFKVTTIK